jgi:hypothetical protein
VAPDSDRDAVVPDSRARASRPSIRSGGGNRLVVNNRTPDSWNDVEIKINRQ